MGLVVMNTANPRRGEQNRFGSMLIEPPIDRQLVAQINCIALDGQNPAFLLLQPTH